MTKEIPGECQEGTVCLLDYPKEILEKIFVDRAISQMLRNSGNSTFQDYIDLFLESSGEERSEENKGSARQIWSYDLPVEIVEAIGKIVKENPREKISDSISLNVRG